MVAGSWLPRIGRDVRAVRALSDGAREATEGARAAVVGLGALGAEGPEIGDSLFQRGKVRFEPLSRALPHFRQASVLIGAASRSVNRAPQPSIEYLRDILSTAGDDITEAQRAADTGALLLDLLPDLFGKGGRRSYLLAFQSLGESRGTGGVINFYGVLETSRGRVRLTEIAPTPRLPDWNGGIIGSPVRGPQWLKESYGPQKALQQWQQTNLTPNFPVAANILLKVYEEFTGERLDGVVAMDPITLEFLMPAVDPVVAFDTHVTSRNVAHLLLRDSYLRFDSDEQNRFLIEVVDGFWAAISAGKADARRLAEGVAQATSSQHFKVYMRDAELQEKLARLGADGFFDTKASNVQLVYHQNYGRNKVDYYLHRKVSTEIRLGVDGAAQVTTKIKLRNRAPAQLGGAPTVLLGDPAIEGIKAGMNQMLLSVLVPKGVQDARLHERSESSVVPFSFDDSGFPVFWDVVKMPPGSSKTIRLEYRIPEALDEGERFELLVFPQTLVHPEQYDITIRPPEGKRLWAEGADSPEEVISLTGALSRPLQLAVWVN